MEDNKDTKVENAVETVKEETVKTYTQENLDNSFKAGYKKANADLQDNAEYKEFLEWKKTSQNDSEKLASLQASFDELQKENKTLKATNKVANADVKPEFVKFVTSEVLGLVDDKTDFDTALKNFKNDNPQYFGEVVVKKVQTSPTLNGGVNQQQTTNNIMNDILRSAKN